MIELAPGTEGKLGREFIKGVYGINCLPGCQFKIIVYHGEDYEFDSKSYAIEITRHHPDCVSQNYGWNCLDLYMEITEPMSQLSPKAERTAWFQELMWGKSK